MDSCRIHQHQRLQGMLSRVESRLTTLALHQLKCERMIIADLFGASGSPQHRYLKSMEYITINEEGQAQCWSRGLRGYSDDLEHTFEVSPLILKGLDDDFKAALTLKLQGSASQHKALAQQHIEARRKQLQAELNNLQSL